ncbi:MAG TPA: MBL fold metallo-hydrolase [Anaerolineae bacterium]|nr:MBL fold metallo-hydrolase [Anaerolineae bacterium]
MKLTIIVDDRAQPGSPFRAEHGASFAIENQGRTLLFDTGGSGEVLLHNLEAAGVAPERIDAVILSHGHQDHTGGLAALLARAPGLPVHAHPDLFRERFVKGDTGPRAVGPPFTLSDLESQAVFHLDSEPREVLPGIWSTGEIGPRPEAEGRGTTHLVRGENGWDPDPYRDDMSVVVKVGGDLVLVCGCCHAGLLNTLATVRRTFGQDPVAVVGGLHLVSTDTPTMEHIIEVLAGYGPPQFWVGHCTGDRGFLRLKMAFGSGVGLYSAGAELAF